LRQGAVWFVKHCPEHGRQEERIYGDDQAYLALPHYHRAGQIPLKSSGDGTEGCPSSCGICSNHEQHICMPIVEITDHCDMACPVCLVKTPGTFHLTLDQVNGILDRLLAAEGQIDILNLSGGEPTVHPDFRAIIEACLDQRPALGPRSGLGTFSG
jgi:uncharacterized radical SAM superfamily Fe-S cluster-containing enzyme